MASSNTNKIRFLYESVLDVTATSDGLVTISASSAASGLPAANVQDPLIRKVYRTTGISTEFLRWDLGSPQTIRQFFIGNHNFTKTATVTIAGHTSDNFTSPSFNATLTIATDAFGATIPKINTFFATAQTYRHWRLKMIDTANPSAGLEIGRVMGGSPFDPRRNLSDRFIKKTIDPSRGVQTAGRQGYWRLKKKYQELSARMSFQDRTDLDDLEAFYRRVGMHSPFVIALQPETLPTKDSFYVQFSQPLDFEHIVLDSAHVQRIVLSEKN